MKRFLVFTKSVLNARLVRASLAALLAVLLLFSIPRVRNPESEAIVEILTLSGNSGGTGFNVKYRGKTAIVTNDHVCAVHVGGYVIVKNDSGQKFRKKILKRNEVRDLCLVEGIPGYTATVGENAPERFETLKVIGHPFLKMTTISNGQYLGSGVEFIMKQANEAGECADTEEVVETMFGRYCALAMELSSTSIEIHPGNSGSPVFNDSNEVVGVINSADNRDNKGMFVPLSYLKDLLE